MAKARQGGGATNTAPSSSLTPYQLIRYKAHLAAKAHRPPPRVALHAPDEPTQPIRLRGGIVLAEDTYSIPAPAATEGEWIQGPPIGDKLQQLPISAFEAVVLLSGGDAARLHELVENARYPPHSYGYDPTYPPDVSWLLYLLNLLSYGWKAPLDYLDPIPSARDEYERVDSSVLLGIVLSELKWRYNHDHR